MISIVSGPTCVGKTYFIDNKKDRLLELNNLSPTTESYVTGSFSSNHLEFPDVVSHWKKRNGGGAIVDQIACIHCNIVTGHRRTELINAYKDNDDYFLKKVIILGVPYSEYKSRVQFRWERHALLQGPQARESRLKKGPRVQPSPHYVNVYKDWINDLNKNEIPYVFVEAIGDYKVLEEEEFFRMLND
jgi:hypothetical protein